MPLPYNLSSISEDHLNGLIGEEEGPSLDFKLSMEFPSQSEKFDLCADVGSFANENGGDIVIGVSEETDQDNAKTGRAQQVIGIDFDRVDELERSMTEIIMRGTEPRVKLRFHTVLLQSGKVVIVVRIPKSANAPHATKAGDNYRFYGRNRKQKYILDVRQIRERFFASDSIEDRIDQIVSNLADRILKTPPANLQRTQFGAAYLIPSSALIREGQLDVRSVLGNPGQFASLIGGASNLRMSTDGCLIPRTADNGRIPSYLLAMRSGVIEYVTTEVIRNQQELYASGDRSATSSILLIETFAKALAKLSVSSCAVLSAYGFDSPFYLSAFVQDMQGHFLSDSLSPHNQREPVPIDRNRIVSPTVVFEEAPTDSRIAVKAIRPILEYFMNCGGLDADRFFDGSGDWVGSAF